MTLSDLASLGSFVSGVAVLVSLVFLYFQLRQISQQVKQAEKNQQASIRHGRTNRVFDMFLRTAESESLSDIRRRWLTGGDLTPLEYDRALSIFNAWVTSWEETFYQHQEGILSDGAFATFATAFQMSLSWPGFRAAWKVHRPSLGPEFLAFIDGLMAATPVAYRGNPLDQWKEKVAEEKAFVAALAARQETTS